jgi:peptidoglycan hydrolase CwlO-like protein
MEEIVTEYDRDYVNECARDEAALERRQRKLRDEIENEFDDYAERNGFMPNE